MEVTETPSHATPSRNSSIYNSTSEAVNMICRSTRVETGLDMAAIGVLQVTNKEFAKRRENPAPAATEGRKQ